MLAFSSFLPTIPPKPMLTFSDEDAGDAAEEGEALAALAATARDAKEATDEICVDVFVDDNNAGERERESSSEDEEEAAPILLSAMAVARCSPRNSVAFQLFHVCGPTPRMSQTVNTVSRSSRSRVLTALAKSRTVRGSAISRFCAMSDISR